MTHSCGGRTEPREGEPRILARIKIGTSNDVPCELSRKALLASEPLQGKRCYLRRTGVEEMSVRCVASRNNIAAGRRKPA